LAGIAYEPILQPFSHQFSKKVDIAPSSIKKSMDVLLRDDWIYKDKHDLYQVLDPAVRTYLLGIRYFGFL